MNRHDFNTAAWPKIFWLASMLNPMAFMPQIWKVFAEHKTEGVSLVMFGVFVVIQLAYLYQGVLIRNRAMVVTMGMAAVFSLTIIGGTLYYG